MPKYSSRTRCRALSCVAAFALSGSRLVRASISSSMALTKVMVARSTQKARAGSCTPRTWEGRQCIFSAMDHTSQIKRGSLAKGKHRLETTGCPVEEEHLVHEIDLV